MGFLSKNMKKYIFDRNKEKFIFPTESHLIRFLCNQLPSKVSISEVKEFIKKLNNEQGVYITVIDDRGKIQEDSPSVYFTDIVTLLREEGRIHEE